MKTKIKPKICKYQEKTISFHPSTLSNFFYPTPLKLHKTFSQHLNFKNGQNTTIISHQSESSHILKCTYTHPPSTSHPSFRRRSLLLTPHAPPRSTTPRISPINQQNSRWYYIPNHNHFSSPIFLCRPTIQTHTHSLCKWKPPQHQYQPHCTNISNKKDHPQTTKEMWSNNCIKNPEHYHLHP